MKQFKWCLRCLINDIKKIFSTGCYISVATLGVSSSGIENVSDNWGLLNTEPSWGQAGGDKKVDDHSSGASGGRWVVGCESQPA